jgi:hypothetical protein
MARKKTVKKAKKTLRNQAKAKVAMMNSVEMMEKNFKNMPKQVAVQCQKELATVRQYEKKLSVELKKAQILVKEIKAKCVTLASKKTSATSKKQLAAAKKGLVSANTAIKEMTAKWSQLTKQIAALRDKQGKFTALSKELSKFDTQRAKTAKKAAPAKKAAKSKKTKTHRSKKSSPTIMEESAQTMHALSATSHDELQEIETTDKDVTLA